MASTVTVERSEPAAVAVPLRGFYCRGCGRRQFRYRPDTLGREAVIQVRCRCKTESELRGADVPELLQAISEGRAER